MECNKPPDFLCFFLSKMHQGTLGLISHRECGGAGAGQRWMVVVVAAAGRAGGASRCGRGW